MELPGGNYKVLFRLKISDNTESEPIAKLYVKATRAGSEQELASFTLRPIHFSQAGAWEVFELPVEIRDDDTNIKIGVEFYGGVADLWCDWIRAVPAGTSLAGDLKVLGSVNTHGGLKIGGKEVISSGRRLKNVQLGEVREARASGSPPQSAEITPARGTQFIPVWASAQAGTTISEVNASQIIQLLNLGKRIVKLKAITDYDGRNTTAQVIAVDEDNNEIVLCSSGAPGQTIAVAVVRAWEI